MSKETLIDYISKMMDVATRETLEMIYFLLLHS